MANEGSNSSVPFATSSPDIGVYFKKGWDLYRQSFGLFLIASLAFWALSLVSLSILMGPLTAGYLFLFVRKLRGAKVDIGDLFLGFRRFVPIVLVFYITKFLVAIGIFLGVKILPVRISAYEFRDFVEQEGG